VGANGAVSDLPSLIQCLFFKKSVKSFFPLYLRDCLAKPHLQAFPFFFS
jgi:hypothetical protein